ncbi:MAG: peptidoglycan DD-metalloendopeptidase family protein [Bdellovibrionales bacterium]
MRVLSIFVSVLVLSACVSSGGRGPAPVTVYGTSQGPGSSGAHNVARGDTLWTISQRYNIVMRDIVIENSLAAPFELTQGQRLILPPPREYSVRQGDSVSTVARLFDVSASEIVRINDLREPYRLRSGQVIRLPSGGVPLNKPVDDNVGGDQVVSPERVIELQKPVRKPSRSMRNVVDDVMGDIYSDNVASKPSDSVVIKPGRKPNVKIVETAKSKVKKSVPTPKRASSKFLKPTHGKIVSGYGPKDNGLHNDGINIAAARGSPVKAADNGVVVYAGDGLKGSGNLILVRHDNRWMTAYGHLDRIKVANGEVVKRGSNIGTVGSTGSVKTPQLHFEIRRGTKALNPKPYLE